MAQQESDLEPRQERSRRTLARLLSATIEILDESGLEGAIIPRIALKAGVSPATVYRRFENKQDLLRAAFMHMVKASNEQNHLHLAKELTRPTLTEAVRRFLELDIAQYRKQSQRMWALKRFMEAEKDSEFVQTVQDILADNMNVVIQAILAYRKEIAHPKPERAVRIATLMAATAVETMFFSPRSVWATLQPISDEALIEELTRAYVAYLKST